MSKYLHKLAEALRSREKLLEDHSEHPAFESESGDELKAEYDNLIEEVQAFSKKLEAARAKGADFDEHYEREINDEHDKISVKIDAWSKKLP
ncbi:hypothetical protein [Kordiimonas sp.]|uniref:hypothetical protein n=1 Tax=Kordiimonas sp. TaxID=1970157 RepID=UPI003A953011